MYRFVIIYAVHRVPIIISGLFQNGFARCLITDVYVNQRTVIAGLMPVGGYKCLYWYIVSNINIVCSVIYICCSLFVKIQRNTNYFKASLWELWLPVFFTLILILPANFSTTALIFAMVLMLVFIGKYPLKYMELL
jgi:cell division protein FtsW